MKKEIMVVLAFIILLHGVSAALEVQTYDKASVVIAELDNPAVFDVIIDNSGSNDSIDFYSYVGLRFSPVGTIDISRGENQIELKAYPNKQIRSREGLYTLSYEVNSRNTGAVDGQLTIRVVSLEKTLAVSAQNLALRESQAIINVKNTQNTYLENVKINFSSIFFDEEQTISLEPYEEINLTINVDQDRIKNVIAGNYLFNANIQLENAKTQLEGNINYVEGSSVATVTKITGWILKRTTITKTNEGNVPTYAQIDLRKGIIGRLFTAHAIAPIDTQRDGLGVNYIWEKELQPGESYVVESSTNYTIPFILLVLVIIIAFIAQRYTKSSLVVSKRVSYVRTRGGEFALKVRLHVKAKANVEKIEVHDRLPATTQLYDKFGIKPNKIDHANRKLTWEIDRLRSGEERIFSYIVYSKVKVVGRFELPSASATFSSEGKHMSVISNRAFFVSETMTSSE